MASSTRQLVPQRHKPSFYISKTGGCKGESASAGDLLVNPVELVFRCKRDFDAAARPYGKAQTILGCTRMHVGTRCFRLGGPRRRSGGGEALDERFGIANGERS